MISVKEPRTEILTLPWPPSANNSKMPIRGRMVSTKKLREYHLLVAMLFKGKVKPMDPPYHVTLDMYEPDRRRRDLSNFEKALVDSLVQWGLLQDDCWVDRYEFTRDRDTDLRPVVRKDGRVVVTVKEIQA